jgi:hypothetical protein
MSKHTPGPWASNSADSFELCVYGNCHRIAKMAGGEINRDIANARLIAAAPELLEALQDFLNWSNSVYYGKDTRRELVRAKDKASAAIAKATGEQA